MKQKLENMIKKLTITIQLLCPKQTFLCSGAGPILNLIYTANLVFFYPYEQYRNFRIPYKTETASKINTNIYKSFKEWRIRINEATAVYIIFNMRKESYSGVKFNTKRPLLI